VVRSGSLLGHIFLRCERLRISKFKRLT
jgi:hypothetical protein